MQANMVGRPLSGGELKCRRLGDLSPRPLGFFAFFLLQQKDGAGTIFVMKTARPFCCLQAPVGARVASQRCPILRWSKGSVSRFRFLGGL